MEKWIGSVQREGVEERLRVFGKVKREKGRMWAAKYYYIVSGVLLRSF